MECSKTWREEVTFRFEPDNLVTVAKFRSIPSGLTLVLADVQGPIIEACFCVSKSIKFRQLRIIPGFESRPTKNEKVLMVNNLI